MYTYKKLEEITKIQKPYRGSTNRYPTGNRLHSTKNFFVEELDGEKVFKVTYGSSTNRELVSKETYDALPDVSRHEGKNYDTQEPEYWHYTATPYELGIMRPDETFEFTAQYLHQGTNMYLTNEFMPYGVVSCSSRHGGVIYKDQWRNHTLMFPIFKGLRIHTDTFLPHESQNIKLIKNNIDRKLAKPLIDEYGDMIKTSGVMFSAMEIDLFLSEAKEIIKDAIRDAVNKDMGNQDLPYLTPKNQEKLKAEANKCNRDGRYFDCAVINAFLMDANRLQYILRWGNSNYNGGRTPLSIHQAMIRGLTKQVYKNEEPFTKTEIVWGQPYPSSDWGFELTLNGEEKTIYG